MTAWLVLMTAAPAKCKAVTDSGWSAADWAVLSTAFAAVAALASLVAVLQNRRVMSSTLQPLLSH